MQQRKNIVTLKEHPHAMFTFPGLFTPGYNSSKHHPKV